MIHHELPQSITMRVTKSAHISRAGILFNGVEVSDESLVTRNEKVHYIVRIDEDDVQPLIKELKRGTIMKVGVYSRYEVKSDYDTKRYIINTKQVQFLKPSGQLVISLLGNSVKFKGIGPVKAKTLWQQFGGNLIKILDGGDVDSLAQILTRKIAEAAVEDWKVYIRFNELEFCSYELDLPISMSIRVLDFYRGETIKKLTNDPYRLLAFGLSFKACDKMALKFRIAPDSTIRARALIEQALYDILATGSTLANYDEMTVSMLKMLNKKEEPEQNEELVKSALQLPQECGNYKLLQYDNFQSNGAFFMEATVAHRVHELVSMPPSVNFSAAVISNVISNYEQDKNIELTPLQKEAVFRSFKYNFFIINGGAGVGKTSVLGALYEVMKTKGVTPIQLALTGKAAKRMFEATGIQSYTIARFILVFDFAKVEKSKVVVVIDESSMVDLLSMYRLLKCVPEGVKFIMTGDVGQLPPVDFGKVFHELVALPSIPQIMLKEITGQSTLSNIPTVAAEIRKGKFPAAFFDDVRHIEESSRFKIEKQAVTLFFEHPHRTQIICATNKMACAINARCSALNKGQLINIFADDIERYVNTSFKVNDKVLFNKNLYDYDFMNGSIGIIKSRYKPFKEIERNEDEMHTKVKSFGKILWDDGVERDITIDVIDVLQLAYAITIHKSQGSKFDRVIVPVEPATNLDQAMLYTALTRASKQNIIIGAKLTLKKAISIDSSSQRKVHLSEKYLAFCANQDLIEAT
jgi:exodeoxyribonuclease V alpha subunit